MTDITFVNSEWSWVVIGISFLVLIVLIWKEYRQSKSRFVIRIIVSIIAILSLALLALRPTKRSEVKGSQLIVLTNGYEKEIIDSLKKIHKNVRVTTYNGNGPIFKDDNPPSEVLILGQGIPEYDLWQLDSIEATYIASPIPSGIIKLRYDKESSPGQGIMAAGEYHQPTKGHRLVLNAPGGIALDSMVLNDGLSQKFQFFADNDVVGNYVYHLIEKNKEGEIIQSNPLPVTVKPQQPLNILILNSFPTFETKYLKTYLAEMGHHIRIRSQVTKGRFKYEYFNTKDNTFPGLTREGLSKFQLAIIDTRSLNNLSRQQINEIKNAIIEDGLGLFVQPDVSLTASRSSLVPFKFRADANQEVIINSIPKLKLTKYPYQFNEEFLLESIHTSESIIVSAYKRHGVGRIGTTLLFNTYEFLLKGNSRQYKQIWSRIIESVSKTHTADVQWPQAIKVAYLDEPFHFRFRTSIEEPNVKNSNGTTIPIMNSPYSTNLWSGTTYPKTKKWNQLIIEQDTAAILNYYVFDVTHWKSLRAYSTQLVNKRRFSHQINPSGNRLILKAIHPIWFFCAFIVAMSFLWIEPKL